METYLFSSAYKPSIVKSEPPSTLHMMQWENIRLEAESRFSTESSLLCSSSAGRKTVYKDIFLELWNSDVGERFRNITKLPKKEASESPTMTQASSRMKFESSSYITSEERPTVNCASDMSNEQDDDDSCYKVDLDMMTSSDSNFNEFSDSSANALKLLVDLPSSTSLGFLQDQPDSFSDFLDLQTD
ncbi:putative r2r3-myb transcription factor [Corchorus capsularis]|uniref:Putative r2r3-myb transcription factor n=1 Tax=Corchorus capsularis TaxID=210143 RepID=A0A1R3JM65_COCAP|nr:putative r2r3-myb transcription factor [Corchorus capsularis]